MPTDKQNVEFLYSIIKQLEVKYVNWSLIAESNTIPNGHAARMRFQRLRQAMEGTAPRPRIPKDPDDKKGNLAYKRKAKYDAESKLRKKIAELEASEDDEGPLARVARKRMRIKMEEEEDDDDDHRSGGDYVNEGENIRQDDDSLCR